MQNALKAEIKKLALRAFAKASLEERKNREYRSKYEKRTGLTAGTPSSTRVLPKPRHFDPRYCARNANLLAKTIWFKVLTGTYEPGPAVNYQIPKADGTKRSIMAFSIPDAALANVVLRRARSRNTKRLSPSSYAYHPDKNVFDAIIALREYSVDGKLFAVQIDFEKYFDNIPSAYLKKKISDKSQISLTPHERHVFESFMHHRHAEPANIFTGPFVRRHKGTPQGSSVSLLLAKIANHDLDVKLSSQPGKFVRFADDVVALCENYSQSQEIERCFTQHCRTSGLKLNLNKSPGIAVISETHQELRTYPYFDYLGYRFLGSGLSIPEKTERRIKARISRLVHIYLIKYLETGFNPSRSSISPSRYDWDLLGLIYEIRRSMYGGLSESHIHRFLNAGTRLPKMKGLMGFYCLLDDPAPLRRLDGWLVSVIRRAMRRRNQILLTRYGMRCVTPSDLELINGSWLDPSAWRGPTLPESGLPSFMRGWRAARKHFFTFGLERVSAPNYGFYSDLDAIFDYI